MAPPARTVKIVFSGTISGSEIFNHGVWMGYGVDLTQDDLNSEVAAFADSLKTQWLTAAVQALYPTTTVWQSCTGYYYKGGSTQADLVAEAAIGAGGSAVSGSLPNQVAMVATLLSLIPGRRNRGRSYLPAPGGGAITGSGQLSNANVDTLATAFANLIVAMNGRPLGGSVYVVSQKYSAMVPVQSIRIDSRLDVQRRRANKQVIAYSKTLSTIG